MTVMMARTLHADTAVVLQPPATARRWRAREGRDAAPSAAALDAQSTRSFPQGGPSDFGADKKVKGRKRSLVVDALGLLLAVGVGAANLRGRDAVLPAVARAAGKYPEAATLFVDSACA
jgi:hypothetical protein